MFRIEVKNLGPIIEGRADIKPLTIFIGRNNSGKSYLATAIYALLRSLRLLAYPPFLLSFTVKLMANENVRKVWEEWLRKQKPPKLDMTSLPGEVKGFLNTSTRDLIRQRLTQYLASEMKRCFKADIPDLVRQGKPGNRLSLCVEEPSGLLLSFTGNEELKLDKIEFKLPEEVDVVEILPFLVRRLKQRAIAGPVHVKWPMADMIYRVISAILRSLHIDPYYLPAARSGILQGHKGLAASMIERSPLIGIEEHPEIPKITGVVTDFLGTLLRIEPEKKAKLREQAAFLEREILSGKVVMKREKLLYPEIYYQPELMKKMGLHRTSSGVSELAPIVLFLKYVVEPGSLLIIEEPEAHLHPQAQRKLARLLARLIKADVKVLITTHSDYLVQELSNLVLSSQIQSEKALDRLYASEVAVYLFKLTPEGSIIEPIEVDEKEGIKEEEFAQVSEELYRETVEIERQVIG